MKFFQSTAKFFGIVRASERGDLVTVTGIDGEILAAILAKIFETNAINKSMFTMVTNTSMSFERFFVPDMVFMLTKLVSDPSVKWSAKRTSEKIIGELLEKTWFKTSTQEHKPMVDVKLLRKIQWRPLPHQLEFLELYGERMPKYDLTGILLGAAPGTGKAQPLDSPIRTPTGWTTMGDMHIGDLVSTPDGSSAAVVGVFPQGEKDIYRVTFEDGRWAECCEEHLWKVYSKDWKRAGNGWQVLSLENIQRYLEMTSYQDRLYVPLPEPVPCEEKLLPIDPYVLGIILGDGYIGSGHVGITSADQFIVDEVTSLLGDEYELVNRKRNGEKSLDYYIATKIRANRWHPSNLMKGIRDLNLTSTRSDTKFIPANYLDSSISQRRSLFQGLMDSDGTVDKKTGSVSYCTVSKQLARDMQELVRSLGGLCKISKRQTTYTHDGEKRQGKLAYQLSIRIKDPADSFRLQRKKALTPSNYQYEDSLRLRIKSIDFVSRKQAQCISIDHPDHLYITNDYVVTHNTFTDLMVATCLIPPEIAEVKIIISPKKAVHLVWADTLRKVFKKSPTYWVSDTGAKMPTTGTEYYIFNFEALDKAVELGKALKAKGIRYFVIVDESHNFADWRSARTQKLVTLQTLRNDIYFVWASGSPILKSAAELTTFLKCSDKRFSAEAERRFRKIYAASPGRANEIFNHRLGQMMAFMVPKSVVSKTKPKVIERPVKLPPALAKRFLMETVREEMREFIIQRLAYYDGEMQKLRAVANQWLDYHDTKLTTKAEHSEFEQYLKDIKIISKNPDLMIKEVLDRARKYERTKLIPSLPPTARRPFRNALSAIKNIKLKVRGEALGTVLSKRRAECAEALALHCRPEDIIKDSLSKTLFFASSVLPIKSLTQDLEKKGFNPLMVYGGTNTQLVSIMEQFADNPNINPVCATMQSLSEAVPVIAASTIVLLNRPYRQATYDQIVARADRLGQQHPVTVVETTLDTGGVPNVSSRTDEILTSIRETINALIGEEFAGPSLSDREYQEAIDLSVVDPEFDDIDAIMA